jgi:hypothetical protein
MHHIINPVIIKDFLLNRLAAPLAPQLGEFQLCLNEPLVADPRY